MIAAVIRWSLANRLLVLLAAAAITAAGIWSALTLPLDAIPDPSDVQVIVRTSYPGQAPQVVQDQVTYPLTTAMLSVPGATTVRGYSFFGDSYVYVIFADGTDLYWARSRVLEYLAQIQSRLPASAQPALGPDATGVGWIYQYALVDRGGRHDLAELRALQDWFLRFELTTVPNVAEVATVGGFNRQYQVVLDPVRLQALRVTPEQVTAAVRRANAESGGSVVELGEAEYMVRARGYLRTLEDFRTIPVGLDAAGTPILLGDVAWVQTGPEIRRGIAELDGEGEVVGGIVVMRFGQNALATLRAVKARIEELRRSLPEGVEIVETYDRSDLIERAVVNLRDKLVEEFLVVALVCAAFLLHVRSAFVAIVTLPLGILLAAIVMRQQGLTSNIMSLGGIAIAIGAMVDASVVMIENAHKKLEGWRHAHAGIEPDTDDRLRLIGEAATEVGPALFFALLIITLSFLPIFALEAQEGRLFAPLAYTKTYAMAAAAALSITLIPVLMTTLIRGRIRDELANPLNRWLIRGYRPLIELALHRPLAVLAIAVLALAATAWPASRLGSEFMPPLDEGDLLYMPTALPGLSAGKAAEILQQTDRIIRQFPEVKRVFGIIGRAETATDPAPLEMVDTTVQLRPREEWRPGMTPETLVAELDAALQIPGMGNIWVQPIRNRIDMFATGIKSPVGIKIAGPDLEVIGRLGAEVESAVRTVPGATSAFFERVSGGRYIEITPNRLTAARYGLNVEDIQDLVATTIGGAAVGQTVEGPARFPISVRYPRDFRDSVEKIRELPFVTARGEFLTLGQIADVAVTDGAPAIRSENARLNGWVYVDIHGRDLGSFVAEARQVVADRVALPAGYTLTWSGQFEYLQRAAQRLQVVVPLTLAVIVVLLYLSFRSMTEAVLIVLTLPLALIGGFWLAYLLDHHLSVASAVGFIALAGVAAEFGVVTLVYLEQAVRERQERGALRTPADLRAAIMEGAVMRVRPKAMTVTVIVASLLPLFWGSGTGSEVMQRIAAPMIGGMITAPLLSMVVIPAGYYLLRSRRRSRAADSSGSTTSR
ncbi:MAG: CusA/CzcA family heavy metal efflux RND transporter [Gammaproteobacteria bacterium]|nr:CusA/CzcA family heavy metal efflux RND transporter [Gammaproteobacteria bacterium]